VIDIDRIDEQLASAVSGAVAPVRKQPAPVPTPTSAPAPAGATPRPERRAAAPMRVPELLELGLVDEAEAAIAAATDPRDALTWATMRALLHGDQKTAAAGIAKQAQDAGVVDRYWAQRFWAAVQWGAEEERYDVLDHCRTRAYRFDDLVWWGNLTLLLAAMGKSDEALRAFDEALPLLAGVVKDAAWLDVLTNLIEAAALLGDAGRVAGAGHSLRWPEDRLVVLGPGVVCKGSVERYRALVHAASGRWDKAAECFGAAEAVHRAIGAGPLLRRTLQQATGSLAAA
jgi:tetratricopeptide (TPR) repeat protein